jgi:hypothetical protein
MPIDLTAREAEKLLMLMNYLLEGPRIDPEIVAIARKLEVAILEQNKRTEALAQQYLQASRFPSREKPLPEA